MASIVYVDTKVGLATAGLASEDYVDDTEQSIITQVGNMNMSYYTKTEVDNKVGLATAGLTKQKTRTIVSGATTTIGNSAIGNVDIEGFKSYNLMKVGLSTAGWLRLYTDSTSRANDASRSIGIDPAPGIGVIAEVVTTGISTTQIISPFVAGGNLDEPATNTIYASS